MHVHEYMSEEVLEYRVPIHSPHATLSDYGQPCATRGNIERHQATLSNSSAVVIIAETLFHTSGDVISAESLSPPLSHMHLPMATHLYTPLHNTTRIDNVLY